MDFKLPKKDIISKEMPRYSNVWFYVNSNIVEGYLEAVYLVIFNLMKYCNIKDNFSENYRLRYILFNSNEGSDTEGRYKGLQPYTDIDNPSNSHDHQLHIRYYYKNLINNKSEKVKLNINNEDIIFYRLALSVHYEVTTENKNHPFVEFCPICGRAGIYDIEVDQNDLDKGICKKIHDPLGVEILLKNTIRGNKIYNNRGEQIKFIERLKKDCDLETYIVDITDAEINTPKIGHILIKKINYGRDVILKNIKEN